MTFQANPNVIRWRLHLRSSPEVVYGMLATDDGRAAFWAETAVEVDGVIHFRFVNGVEYRGRVLEADPPRRFRLDYFRSTVDFMLEPDGEGGTDLTMTNSCFHPDDRAELLAGWLNVLLPLKAAVDFGVDLRGHDPTRTWEGGYVDQ